MNKYILIALLGLTGCTEDLPTNADLKVGDCGQKLYYNKNPERWDKTGPQYVFKVIELGKYNYRVYQYSLENRIGYEISVSYSNFNEWTDIYSKIDCNVANKLIEGTK